MLEFINIENVICSKITCDSCGLIYMWKPKASLYRMQNTLRKQEGWSVGKKHICKACKWKKKYPGYWSIDYDDPPMELTRRKTNK